MYTRLSPTRRTRTLTAVAIGAVMATTMVVQSHSASAACGVLPPREDPAVTRTVYSVGRDRGASARVMLAAFETGWVESHMNNLGCGDRDSLGVFQQRSSWGTVSARMTPTTSAGLFFDRAVNVDRDPKFKNFTAGQLAQKVQVSKFPGRYDTERAKAEQMMADAARAADAATGSPRGALDLVSSPSPGVVRVGGWTFDPSNPSASNHVHVYVGNEGHNLGATGGSRADVNKAYAITGTHGYDATFTTNATGSVSVCAYGINNYAPGTNTQIGCKTITVKSPNPTGALDSATSPSPGVVRVGGWTFDPSNPSASNQVHVYVGNEGHNLGATTNTRSDVNTTYAISGKHGYDATFTTKVKGSVRVCAYGINNYGPGTNAQIGCKTITVR